MRNHVYQDEPELADLHFDDLQLDEQAYDNGPQSAASVAPVEAYAPQTVPAGTRITRGAISPRKLQDKIRSRQHRRLIMRLLQA